MNEKLKPCPFCGGKAEYIRVGDNKQYYVVRCSACMKILVPNSHARNTKWGARREWNRRSDNG